MGVSTSALLIAALVVLPVSVTRAQSQIIQGVVVAEENRAPLKDASVRAVGAMVAATTDRFGRFSLGPLALPDTMIIAFIGRRPVKVAVYSSTGPLHISLAPSPIPLNDIVVSSSGSPGAIASVNRWDLPSAALRLVPAAIEADPLRSLSLVPMVSFSTPLSARPIIRGYDADHSSIRLDGFELVNPYHIGRFFGALPAEAIQQVTVASAPLEASIGGATAGIIEVTGRTGPTDSLRGGANLSLISASPWISGGGSASWFGAGRLVHLSALDRATGSSIPYDFQDVYLGGALSGPGGQRARVTAFASRDDLFDNDDGIGMKWSNRLLGIRSRPFETSHWALDLSAVTTRFSEDASNVEARFAHIDVQNRFGRTGGSADVSYKVGRTSVHVGAGFYRRSITNRIHLRSGEGFSERDIDLSRSEITGYAQLEQRIGQVAVQAGVRLETSSPITTWQPRIRLHVPLSPSLSFGAGLGRTSRLFHIISDPRSEPDVAFYDFWLPAGEAGIPVPEIDHASIDITLAAGKVGLRVGGFGSQGRGIGELRPVTDHTVSQDEQFRFGDSRTFGLEAQIGLGLGASGRGSLSASYVLNWSQRQWESSWVPWSQDRRHILRLFTQIPLGRWIISGTLEAASGLPLTPVSQVITSGIPDSTGQGRESKYVYGPENSARSSGTFRGDVAFSYGFRGPGRSRMALGISVINLGFGPVAPVVAKPPEIGGTTVRYDRLFDLPAIPTVTLRIEF